MSNSHKTFSCALLFSTLGLVSCDVTASAPPPNRPSFASGETPPPAKHTSPRREPVEAAIPKQPAQLAQSADAATEKAKDKAKAEKPDARHRQQIVGVWKQNNTGTRWLRIRPDGTATMFIDPDWVAKAIIGNSLIIEIEWAIEDGRALMNSVSGRPNSAFQAVSKLFGTQRDQPIVQLDDDALVLRDEAEDSLSEWSRVDNAATLPKAIAQ